MRTRSSPGCTSPGSVPGTALPPDRTVSLVYSLGWPLAPDAIGSSARAVTQSFTARHPNARIQPEERYLTLQPAGSVIAQHPDAGLKLGRDQRLALVVAAPRPPWTWAALGVLVAAGAAVTVRALRRDAAADTGRRTADFADETAGIHLRVSQDLGEQEVSVATADGWTAAQQDTPVRVRVVIDLGEQSVGPVSEED